MHFLRKPVQMPVPPSVAKIRHVILQAMVWQEHRLMLIPGGLAWLGTNVLRSTVPPERAARSFVRVAGGAGVSGSDDGLGEWGS